MSTGSDALDRDKLDRLRDEVGPSRFGVILQFIVVSIVLRWGASDIRVRHPGHPDLAFTLDGSPWRIEVEHLSSTGEDYSPDPADIRGIAPRAAGDRGYLLLLDFFGGVRWHVLSFESVLRASGRARPRSYYWALEDPALSRDLTTATSKVLEANSTSAFHASFSTLIRAAESASFPWRMEA
jgi:hypothetical protein